MMKIRNENFNVSRQVLGKVPLLLILGMIMLVTGCTIRAETRQTFTEIMSHSRNNTTPEWRGIEPGKTTETEFEMIVSTNPNVFENLSRSRLRGSQLRPEGIRYIWYDTEFQLPTGVTFRENVVSYLHFLLPGYSFPFENILNIAGSPTAYLAGSVTEEFVSVIFLYEETGVVIEFYAIFDPSEMISIQRNCKFDLTESTSVDNVTIYFVKQNNLDNMITTLFPGTIRPGEIPESWIGTEDALKLTAGQATLKDKTVIDCRNT